MKKILFFSPFWGRTGSELLLKHYIMMLDPKKIEYAIAGRNKGQLYADFPTHIKKYDFRTFNHEYKAETASAFGKVFIDIMRFRRKFYSKIVNRNLLYQFLDNVAYDFPADIWYINTIFMPEIIEYAEAHKIKCIVHTHELEHMFAHINKQQTQRLVNYPEHIISVAKRNSRIFETLGRSKKISTIHPFINVDLWKSDSASRQKIRNEFGFGEKTFVWAMSGELDTNKDPLIFTEIAAKVIKQHPDSAFVWFGGNHQSGYSEYAKKQAELLGLGNKIIWAGAIKDGYADHVNAADGMMLTSHRDSFPLVMIEAAALGKPIVAFDSGGISEFLNDDRMGIIINSRDTDLFKDALIKVMESPENYDPEISKKRAGEFDKTNRGVEWKTLMEAL